MKKKTISVAIATYNGETFIQEQLTSILFQTMKVDEIVISDDGSKDRTLTIATEIAQCPEAEGVRFILLTDNTKHGCGGNFEYAMSHCHGDYIFVCSQDDVWLPNKVETVMTVFEKFPNAQCVMHDAKIINSEGVITNDAFLDHIGVKVLQTNLQNGDIKHLDASLLELSVSKPLISGISLCVSKELMNSLKPFPTDAEDQWIVFSAILSNGCYYVNKVLAYYRKHTGNTSGSRTKGLKSVSMLLKGVKSARNRGTRFMYHYEFGKLCLYKLSSASMENDPAFRTAKRIYDIGCKKKRALELGGILGGLALIKIYLSDMRYRRIGKMSFFYDLLYVLQA